MTDVIKETVEMKRIFCESFGIETTAGADWNLFKDIWKSSQDYYKQSLAKEFKKKCFCEKYCGKCNWCIFAKELGLSDGK